MFSFSCIANQLMQLIVFTLSGIALELLDKFKRAVEKSHSCLKEVSTHWQYRQNTVRNAENPTFRQKRFECRSKWRESKFSGFRSETFNI